MVIRAQLAGRGRVDTVPRSRRAGGEFCRAVLSEPGITPVRLGGYLPPADAHAARLAAGQ